MLTNEIILKHAGDIAAITEVKNLPNGAGIILENHVLDLLADYRKDKDSPLIETKDGLIIRNNKVLLPQPTTSITEKIITRVSYGDRVLASNTTLELWTAFNEDRYKDIKGRSNGVSKLSRDDLVNPVKFLRNSENHEDLAMEILANATDDTKELPTLNKIRNQEADAEITLSEGQYDMYSLKSFVVINATVFKALESSYFLNMYFSVTLTALKKKR